MVETQHGSTSMIQRRMQLGYNRAGWSPERFCSVFFAYLPQQIETPTMPNIAWNDILKALRNQQCVLFLGPDLLPDTQLYLELCRFLGVNDPDDATQPLPPDLAACYPAEQLFLFPDEGARMGTAFRLDDFYEQQRTRLSSLYEQLSDLPIPLIVSTLPDNSLFRAFEHRGEAFQPATFNYRGNAPTATQPATEKRILFRLFGDLADANSLVLTHDDLFDFLSQIMGARKLSDTHIHVQEMLVSKSTVFLFLGFQFDRWYMQILLRLLNPKKFKPRQYVVNPRLAHDTRVFFGSQFRMEFLGDCSPADFLTELCQRWHDDAAPGAATAPPSFQQQLLEWLKQAHTERVLEALEKHFREKNNLEHLNDTILLSSQYNKLELQVLKNQVTHDQAKVESARIHAALLGLIGGD